MSEPEREEPEEPHAVVEYDMLTDGEADDAACYLCPEVTGNRGVQLTLVLGGKQIGSTFVCGECISCMVQALVCTSVHRELEPPLLLPKLADA